jgi:hypothetical protein
MPKLIIGMGTGRCGTLSIAEILSRAGVPTTHELSGTQQYGPIYWKDDWKSVNESLRYKCTLGEKIGDVSLWWLPYVPRIRKHFPSAKFFALRRDKLETINSFLRKTGFTNQYMAHWCENPPSPHPWDKCFPNCGRAEDTKEVNLGVYWDSYYEMCEKYHVPIWETEDLNDPDKLQTLFSHLGISKDAAEYHGHKTNSTIS